jgi:hypothetical protein
MQGIHPSDLPGKYKAGLYSISVEAKDKLFIASVFHKEDARLNEIIEITDTLYRKAINGIREFSVGEYMGSDQRSEAQRSHFSRQEISRAFSSIQSSSIPITSDTLFLFVGRDAGIADQHGISPRKITGEF